MPIHLLFPLFSSVVFVLGMMFVKQAIDRGASPWTATFLANVWLAGFWGAAAAIRGEVVSTEAWSSAGIIGVLFILGQIFTYLAYQSGDVSVATPVFGVKVLMVSALLSLLAGTSVSGTVWLAGAMATGGVILIQASDRRSGTAASGSQQALTIALALTAALSLSLFDVAVQSWTGDWNSYAFLPVMFAAAGLLSVVFLPKVDGVRRRRELKALPWMIVGTLLMALQATSMCFSMAEFNDAPRINIVYALRGLWGVILAWMLARVLNTTEASVPRSVVLRRLAGAVLLTFSVLLAISA